MIISVSLSGCGGGCEKVDHATQGLGYDIFMADDLF